MDEHNPVYGSRLAGEDSGLAVVVRELPDDITTLLRPLDGFNVRKKSKYKSNVTLCPNSGIGRGKLVSG